MQNLAQSERECQDHNESFAVTATTHALSRINYPEVKHVGDVSLEISNEDVYSRLPSNM